ncbi:MAG: S-methyl-5-thioribose-1-phosphate isomerase [bacterium]
MKVNGRDHRTVWMENSTVFFIDQNLLPFSFRINKSENYSESCHAIRTMMVRGAGAIGAMAGFAMAQAFAEAPGDNREAYVMAARKEIDSTRPTARNLFHATEKVFLAGMRSTEAAFSEAAAIADKDAADSKRIGEHGQALMFDGIRVETHCNAGWLAFVDYGTALSPIYIAHAAGIKIFVYVDETRPRGQGARLTAWELQQAGVPHVIIPDHAGASLMARGMIDLMITGADRIAINGDTANKIGTFEKAIVAKEFGIPFYIAAPLSTFDRSCESGNDIPIEERSEEELLYQEGMDEDGRIKRIRVASPGSHGLNPAFDVTPAKYITGIITEKGIIKPEKESILKILS